MNSKENSTGTPVSASHTAQSGQGYAYDLNSLQCELGSLAHLLETVVDTINECHFGPPDNRVPHMDRLDALIRISQSTLEGINTAVGSNFDTIGRTTAPKAVA
ncbi:hypothetical protein KD146_13475 [Devosia sp. BSSL-BM10]|uniref:Uncharacterized protein n=1 Tax=Devosia litorisediminis TaxID=2829817 RepID=A0A942EEE0_9HYPH|nr:hypothetical protein [Devosia litorisediminis]MBS3849709.1 hypothetical protein [Devosia litorisediminis]